MMINVRFSMFVIDESTIVDLNKAYTAYRINPFYSVVNGSSADAVFYLASFYIFMT
jgi:hypothetical protein